jgi:hypothetical protein
MRSSYVRKIEAGVRPLLADGEQVLATFIARPRGRARASAVAFAVTQRRVLTLRIGYPIGLGLGGRVKELIDAAPLGGAGGP